MCKHFMLPNLKEQGMPEVVTILVTSKLVSTLSLQATPCYVATEKPNDCGAWKLVGQFF